MFASGADSPHRLLNLAHLSHDAGRFDPLMVLCPSCHAKNDTPQRIAMTRRTRARNGDSFGFPKKF